TSGDPRWSGCCYTADNAQATCMWNKPREISGYTMPGFEVAIGGGAHITPEGAVQLWDASDHHRVVIANEDDWSQKTWRGLGCAIDGGYAVCWVGELADPR